MRSFLLCVLTGAVVVFLIAAFTCTASAADYRLVDRSGNVVMAITHGTTIDLHDLADRSSFLHGSKRRFEDAGSRQLG